MIMSRERSHARCHVVASSARGQASLGVVAGGTRSGARGRRAVSVTVDAASHDPCATPLRAAAWVLASYSFTPLQFKRTLLELS